MKLATDSTLSDTTLAKGAVQSKADGRAPFAAFAGGRAGPESLEADATAWPFRFGRGSDGALEPSSLRPLLDGGGKEGGGGPPVTALEPAALRAGPDGGNEGGGNPEGGATSRGSWRGGAASSGS